MKLLPRFRISLPALVTVVVVSATPIVALADVPTGSEADARAYYAATSKTLGFSTPEAIFSTTLDDVASYLGYEGLSGAELQDLPADVLMSPSALTAQCDANGKGCGAIPRRSVTVDGSDSIPLRSDDILVSRFFAPKIMNIRVPEASRQLGWRKLVRLRARPGSAAEAHAISEGIILFNFFTLPGQPLVSGNVSVNTQVMLITAPASVLAPGKGGPDTLYWLDYDSLAAGGRLSLALNASFDADELQDTNGGVKPYFVPAGCNACHGASNHRPMVNYLDTDHWFDRLDNDFGDLKKSGLPLLVDANTNEPATIEFAHAFDVIRRFNEEADAQARAAQPAHVEGQAAHRWLELHRTSNRHFAPIQRAVGNQPQWSSDVSGDQETLAVLNQYCFRCHGTIKFSVFDRASVRADAALVRMSVAPTDAVKAHENFKKMPPDRELPPAARDLILNFLRRSTK